MDKLRTSPKATPKEWEEAKARAAKARGEERVETATSRIVRLNALAQRWEECGPGELMTRDWWAEAREILGR